MDIRYSPYLSPFIPDGPPDVYWIGAEHKGQPHSGHIRAWLDHQCRVVARTLLSEEQIHANAVATTAEVFGRPFLSVCGCNWCQVAARKMSSAPVAVLVTPPLCPMGGTPTREAGVF